jgi:formate/nitrite transporter FocA (FNT family)
MGGGRPSPPPFDRRPGLISSKFSIARVMAIDEVVERRHHHAAAGSAALNWPGLLSNLIPVTMGNIAGGGVLVAAVYYLVYRHHAGN